MKLFEFRMKLFGFAYLIQKSWEQGQTTFGLAAGKNEKLK